jgi:hypothetical protein
MLLVITLIAGASFSAVVGFAQEKPPSSAPDKVIIERQQGPMRGPDGPPPAPDRMMFERRVQGPEGPPPPGMPGDFIFLATELSFGGKVVKGAPYSAEAITESTQTLSDGNRIVNKSTAAIYRDSEGRTRREQTIRAIGPFASAGEVPKTIFINDPVAGTNYTLDPQNRIARKIAPMQFKLRARTPAPDGAKPGVEQRDGAIQSIEIHSEPLMQKRELEAGVAIGMIAPNNRNARTESLGKQMIEGVEAEGKRTIVTIPAGEIGNERAIEIISEQWYSPELQTIVMTRHSDPRFGENTYRLTNIDRTEPVRSLFEVPGDYTMKEGPHAGPEPMRMRMRTPGIPD